MPIPSAVCCGIMPTNTVDSLLPMSMYHDPLTLSNDNMTLLLMSEKAEVERALLNATFGLG